MRRGPNLWSAVRAGAKEGIRASPPKLNPDRNIQMTKPAPDPLLLVPELAFPLCSLPWRSSLALALVPVLAFVLAFALTLPFRRPRAVPSGAVLALALPFRRPWAVPYCAPRRPWAVPFGAFAWAASCFVLEMDTSRRSRPIGLPRLEPHLSLVLLFVSLMVI